MKNLKSKLILGLFVLCSFKIQAGQGPYYPLKFKIDGLTKSAQILEFGTKLKKSNPRRKTKTALSLHANIKYNENLVRLREKTLQNHNARLAFFETMKDWQKCPRDLKFLFEASSDLAQYSGSPGEIAQFHNLVLGLFAQPSTKLIRDEIDHLHKTLLMAVEKESDEVNRLKNQLLIENEIWEKYSSHKLEHALDAAEIEFDAKLGELIEQIEFLFQRKSWGEKSSYWEDPDTQKWLQKGLNFWLDLKKKKTQRKFKLLRDSELI